MADGDVAAFLGTPTPSKCQYVGENRNPCIYSVEKDGLCIFHTQKHTETEERELTDAARQEARSIEDKFRVEFNNLMDKLESDSAISNCDFSSFKFPRMSFAGKTFKKGVHLRSSEFKQGVDFSDAKFEGDAHFEHCKFNGPAIFTHATFSGAASFKRIVTQVAAFNSVTFCKQVDFAHARFDDIAHFQWSIFGGNTIDMSDTANFDGAQFKNEANFGSVRFKVRSSFEHATFESTVLFEETQFEETATFERANFITKAAFLDQKFKDDVNFMWASFGQELLIADVVFEKLANFNGVTLALRTSILSTGKYSFCEHCSFRGLRIPANSLVTFDNLNLEQASFLDSDLTKIQFRDVKWHQPNLKWHRRRIALWDEFHPHDDDRRHLEKMAENYHQLVSNYESRRDYNTAEDFHIGEMETQRKKRGAGLSHGWRRRIREWLNPYGLYWLMSNYGSSYLQAFLVLVGMLLAISIIFFYSGFQPSKESAGGSNALIEYNFSPDAQHEIVGFGQWVRDYARAILFSLSIITFQRERFYEPVGDWSRFWLFMAVLLLTTQAAMVLLAIRRRFKR